MGHDYGRHRLPYDGLRVLATQAYVGRRKEQYRIEFIQALKLIGEGAVTRKHLRSSWAGATGLTQFLPSELYKHGVDLDGDGRVDIWHSVPDALASAAQQLVNKGWQPGLRWAYEVRAPANADCTIGVPELTKPIGQWLREGFVPVRGQKLGAAEQAQPAGHGQRPLCDPSQRDPKPLADDGLTDVSFCPRNPLLHRCHCSSSL